MRIVLFFLLLTLPGFCQSTPQDVVRKLYAFHTKDMNAEKTIQQNQDCLTPGFLEIITRAYKKQPPADFVDYDIFYSTQDGGMDFEIGESKIQGKEATVQMKSYQRGDYRNPKPDPNWRKKVKRRPMEVLLADVGHGWQIKDIVWVGYEDIWPDGSKHAVPRNSVRDDLTRIGNSK